MGKNVDWSFLIKIFSHDISYDILNLDNLVRFFFAVTEQNISCSCANYLHVNANNCSVCKFIYKNQSQEAFNSSNSICGKLRHTKNYQSLGNHQQSSHSQVIFRIFTVGTSFCFSWRRSRLL